MRPLLSLVLLATAACQTSVVDGGGGNGNGPSTPANLSYELVRFKFHDFTDSRTNSPYAFSANVLQVYATASF